jgi:tryptophan synthase alpha chain
MSSLTTGGVAAVLAGAKAQGRAALIGYLPVGFPDVQTSIRAMRAMVRAGVDVVEVGVPYSDPLMDGAVIQHAVDAALRSGTRVRDTFEAVRQVTEVGAPALVMTYWNVVERFGVEAFAGRLQEAGGAGLITPDLIPDEAGPWLASARAHDLDRVFLVAPSSTEARLRSTAQACRGFVYAASTMGVTGARAAVSGAAADLVSRVRAVTDLPVCVGLGVSDGRQAAEIGQYADGVIVGSALVRCLADATDPSAGVAAVERLATELAEGLRSG